MRENYDIGAFFLGPVSHRYHSELDPDTLEKKIAAAEFLSPKDSAFQSKLTFFQIMFPFGDFVKLKGKILKNGDVLIQIRPIVVRVVQLSLITLYSITLSAIRLYDNRDWKVLAILGLHFSILCAVWWIIRLIYVADARHKMWHVRKKLRLKPES